LLKGTHIDDPSDLANASGLGGIFELPEFLWIAGNGKAPIRWLGAANTADRLTQTGTIVSGVNPYQIADGTAIQSTVFDVGVSSSLVDATVSIHDPALTHDVVAFCFGCQSGSTPASSRPLATRVGGQGWQIFTSATAMACAWSDAGGTISRTVNAIKGSVFLVIMVVDRDGDLTLFSNAISSGGVAVPGGASAGAGIGVGASPSGGASYDGQIFACGHWYGLGIADNWLADSSAMIHDFTHRFTGIYPTRGNRGTFTRASAASWVNRNGIHFIASQGLPRAGDSVGKRNAPERTNKCYNTINLANTTGWSVAGGTIAAVDDSSQLATDGADAWGPNILRMINGTSYGGAVTGNTNKHSISCIMRSSAGHTVELGLRDASGGGFTSALTCNLTTSWVRYTINNVTPGDTDEQFAVECGGGGQTYMIGMQLEEGLTPTTPIPNVATGASATRAAEVLTTSHTPSDNKGSIEATITPLDWSGTEAGAATIITRDTAADLLYANGSTAGLNSDLDGTTTLADTTAPADGVPQQARVRWSGVSMSLDVDGDRDSDTYDETLDGADEIVIATDAEVGVVDLTAYGNGGG
jgi:hypothetical protein